MRLAACAFAVSLVAARLVLAAPVQATQFWLAAEDPVVQRQKHRENLPDYMGLFAQDADWRRAASGLSVFEISAQSVLGGSDDMLRTIFGAMRQRHVAMAVEMGAVLRTAECGGGEGYAPPDLIDRVAGRLRRMGLSLDYWAMDEPVWFAHEKTWGQNACAYPIDEVGRRVARNVAEMRRYFPAIRVGQIDAVTGERVAPRQLVADYAAFAQSFRQQTGQPLAFWHADVAWLHGGQPVMPLLGRSMRALGLRFGAIVGGTPQDATNQQWVADALRHLGGLMADPATRPDDVVVQSWQPLPDRMLPETMPGTITNLLAQAENLAR